jgi:multidrug resistance efflux pump
VSDRLENHAASPAADPGANTNNRAATFSERVRSLRLPDQPAGGGGARVWPVWLLCLFFAGSSGVMAYMAFGRGEAEHTENSDGARPKVADGDGEGRAAVGGEVVHESKGYVIPVHQIQISPQVGGEIIWLAKEPKFEEGAVYKKGAILAEVDPVIYKARLESANAALAVAKVNLQEVEKGSALREIEAAEATLKNMAARLELSKIDERNKRESGVATSRDEREKAIVQITADVAAHNSQLRMLEKLKVSREERLLVARAQVLKAQADIDEADKQLKNCTITAPVTGVILTKKAELGGYVNPLAFTTAGYLCEMADLNDLEMDMSIQERDIAKIHVGQKCRIRPEAFPKRLYDGKVSRLMPIADQSKGTITVRVKVDLKQDETPGKYLKPQMSGTVWFLKTSDDKNTTK